ncbi:MAG: alkaline phosphatase D family protein [Gemmatimonadota bacterium]
MVHDPSNSLSRRDFLAASMVAGASALSRPAEILAGSSGLWIPAHGAPGIVTSQRLRPQLPAGIQSGDVTAHRGLVWSHTDRPARMHVEWSTSPGFSDVRRVRGPAALEANGFTAALDLRDLPADSPIFYRVRFDSLAHPGTWSEPLLGHFRTAPDLASEGSRPLRVAWSGDCVGQGWGIDESRGGMRIFETLRQAEPDVFIHSGDIIYADQPLEPEVLLDDGTIWRNRMTEAKAKVAETIQEFRGNFAYHLLDPQTRAFHASTPMIAQWDDHEVVNNWFPGYQLDWDDRYTVKSASLLAARAQKAMFEFVPIRPHPDHRECIYRKFSYGPLLEIFVVDLRSYRGANTPNLQAAQGPDTAMLGYPQMAWLKESLRSSQALWKVIASDMPVGLVVPDRPRDGQRTYEAWANGDHGPPAGRELEIAELLSFMKREGIRNTVWVTADVHYASAHHYAPERAAFVDFDPFWEFVAGPMHAGTFGPNALDQTFGPDVVFQSPAPAPNRPPSDDLQFFGTLDIDPATRALTVAIHDRRGRRLWEREIPAAGE